MAQESRLVIRVDSKLSEQQVKELDKALMLLERTGLSVTRTAKTTSAQIAGLGRESEAATRSIDRATAVWAKFNSVVAMAGVGLSAVGVVSMFKSVAENVESLRLFSEQIGITTEQLSSLRYAADDMAGVSSRTLDPALRRMTRRIQEAADGSGPAANALKMLRLEAKALSELDVESQLYAVADAMKALPNHADKLRATMAIFDTEGMPLVNMLNKGSEAIREAQQEAELLGQTISQLDAERVGQLNSELAKVTARFDSIKTQAALNMLPAVEGLSAALGVTAEHFDTLAKVTGGVALVALSRYTGGLVEARAETVKGIFERRKAARAELELARAQKAQTAETLRQTLAMDAQNVTRAQVQAAIQADIAAKKRLEMAEAALTRQVTASTAAMGLARNALGLVGGPFGALTLAVMAGTTIWYQHQAALDETRRVLEGMQGPIDELAKKIEGLSRDQMAAILVQKEVALELARKNVAEARSSLETGLALMGDSFKGTRAELETFISQINQALDSGSNLYDVMREAVQAGRIPKSVLDSISELKGEVDKAVEAESKAIQQTDMLTQALDGLTASSHNAAGGIASLNNELSEAAIEGQKYLERLADQALTAGIDTHVGRLRKLVEAGKLEYSDGDFKKALQYAQKMDDVSKRAGAGKGQRSETEIQRITKALREQLDTLGMTEHERIRYRIETSKGTKAEKERAQAILEEIKVREEQEKVARLYNEALREQRSMLDELSIFEQQKELEIIGIGIGDRARQQMQLELQIRQDFAKKRRELEERQRVESTRMDDDMFRQALEGLTEHEQKKLELVRRYAVKRLHAEQSWITGSTRAFELYKEQAQNVAAQSEEAFTSLYDGLTDAATRWVMGMETSFEEVLRSFAAMLVKMQIQAAATQLFGGLFGSFSTPSSSYAPVHGFAQGGYTGDGGKYEVAGIVHKGEGVLSQEEIKALGGEQGFNALRKSLSRGHATGGMAGNPIPAPIVSSAPANKANIEINIHVHEKDRASSDVDAPQGWEQFAKEVVKLIEAKIKEREVMSQRQGGLAWQARQRKFS